MAASILGPHRSCATARGPAIEPSPHPRLRVTDQARSALKRVCDRLGPQVLLLSWPAGVTYLPAGVYSPGPYDVIIGHVAGCPILADLRQLDLYRHHRAVLDVPGRTLRTRPILRVRSTAIPPASAKGGRP